MLSVSADADHNRCVVTFIGSPEAVARAALRGAEAAIRLIDLNHHKGSHPRMGAVDVIPFVPVSGCTMEDCVALARQVGEALGNMGVPVFLYEEAATRPEPAQPRRRAPSGEFEGLRELIGADPAKDPDFGPKRIHPTAGCTAVGARMPLIAFNVNLGTSDLSIARKIARAVRRLQRRPGALQGDRRAPRRPQSGAGEHEHGQLQGDAAAPGV